MCGGPHRQVGDADVLHVEPAALGDVEQQGAQVDVDLSVCSREPCGTVKVNIRWV